MVRQFLCLIFLVTSLLLEGQIIDVTGVILDSESKEPLVGATISCASVLRGTTSNEKGEFQLTLDINDQVLLSISYVGYQTKLFKIKDHNTSLKVNLVPETQDLESVFVESKPDKQWRRNFRKFEHQFFGETSLGKSVQVKNPWVINFSTEEDKLIAESDKLISFDNTKTGYSIDLLLEYFVYDGFNVAYGGKPFFSELAGSHTTERKKAFYGSMRHFFHSLYHGIAKKEGFRIYLVKYNIRDNFYEVVRELNDQRLIKKVDGQVILTSPGLLRVLYINEKSLDNTYANQDFQESFLDIRSKRVEIKKNGLVVPANQVVESGHWSQYERVGFWLPNDYFPEEYISRVPND